MYNHRCGPLPYHDLRTGLTTNKAGNVRLLYWLPGLLAGPNGPDQPTVTVKVTVKAEAHVCRPTGCSLAKGAQYQDVSLFPHLVYTSEFRLPPEQAAVLSEWAAPFSLSAWAASATWLTALQTFAKAISLAIPYIAPEGAALLPLFEAVHNGHTIIEQFDSMDETNKLRIGLLAMFLSDFKLHPNGLGVTRGSAETEDKMGNPFLDLLIGTHGDKSTGGLLYRFAQQLVKNEKEHPTANEAQEMTLNVYEVSYCDQDAADCFPGSPGVRENLYFELVSRAEHFHTRIFPQLGEQGFVVGYSAKNWADAQQGLTG